MSKQKAVDAKAWGALKRHYITLPSSAVVAVEIPDLPELIKAGQIPNNLVDVAVKTAQGKQEVNRELIESQPEFYRLIVGMAVKEPEVTDEVYKEIPTEDKEMIVEIATRQRDVDAVYEHIGGLHTSKRWRTFRGLDDGDETLADV